MNITINGEEKQFSTGMTLLEVLKALNVEEKVMAAALNMEIVKQNSWAQCQLKDGDKLELLDFVGGG